MSSTAVRAGAAFIELTTRDSKLQKGLANAQARLKMFGDSCSQIGRELLTFSAAPAAAFGLAFKTFKDFDTQMRMVKAVTQASGREFDMLTAKARKIGAETSYMAEEVAQAMTALGRMGLNPAEIDAAILPVMNLARATGTELAEAADIAANSLRIFQLDASKMGEVSDYLTATANGSAQTLTDLFEALKIAGPQAKTAGESIQETAAALGIMANMGIKGSLAGTSLRKAYLQFADPKIRDFLKDYNIRTVDANGNLRKMRDIMVDLTKVMATMGSAEKLAFAKQVFDMRGMTGGLAITADTTKLDEFLQKLQNCQGVAQRTREEIESGAGGAFDIMLSALQEVGIVVGEIISQSLVPLMGTITQVLQSFGKWAAENEGFVSVLGGTTATLLVLGGTLVAVGATVKAFTLLVGFAKAGVTAFQVVVSTAAGLKVVWTAAMAAASASTAAFTAATAAGTSSVVAFGIAIKTFMMTNPVGWITLAVGALAALAFASNNAGDAVEDLTEKLAKQREENNRQIAADKDKMARLQELAVKQKLTNAEMAEARQLSSDLETRYGKLGITFNDTAKAISGVAQALELLNKKQQNQQVSDINQQISNAKKKISEYEKMIKEWSSFHWTDITTLGYKYIPGLGRGGRSIAKTAKIDLAGHIAALKRQIANLELERDRIINGTGGTGSGAGGSSTTATTYKDYLEARDGVAKYEQSGKSSSAFDREIAGIKKATAAYKDLLRTMLLYQENRLKTLQKNGGSQAEIKKLEADIASIKKRLAGADAEGLRRETALRERHSGDARSRIEAEGKSFKAEASSRYRDEQRRLWGDDIIRELGEADPATAKSYYQKISSMYGRAMNNAKDEYERLLREAAAPDADGVVRYTDEERAGVAEARERYMHLFGQRSKWFDRVKDAHLNTERRTSNIGSWSAKSLNGMIGGGSAADRTAAATERANQLTIKTNAKLDRMIEALASHDELRYEG